MQNELSISAYSFHIRKKNKKGIEGIYPLNGTQFYKDNLNKEKKELPNFMEVFIDFWQKHVNYSNQVDEQKLFAFDDKVKIEGEEPNYKYFMAKVNAGAYGIESDITDIMTKDIVYEKKGTDADIKPYYVFIAIPKDNIKYEIQKGIIIFQNIGIYGVKTITFNYLKDYLTDYYNMSIYSGSICPEIFVERLFKNSKINKLTLITNQISNDISDNIGIGYGKQEISYSKLTRTKNLREQLIKVINKPNRVLELGNLKCDEVKVNVKDALGRVRTVNLNNINNLSVIETIPNDIRQSNGYPEQKKMLEYFKQVTKEYMEKMTFKITG